MPLPSSINDLSQTAGSNSPFGSESPGTIDDYLRVYASYIAQLRDTRVGRLVGVQVFTASGTYTRSASVTAIRIRLVGGGGGGGGSVITNAAQVSYGSGGVSGSYAEGYFTTVPASAGVTVGAGGSGVAGANGTAGGGSSVGSLISVNGGSPGATYGPAAPPFISTAFPTGVSITGGAYLAIPSEASIIASVLSLTAGYSGAGASGHLGSGGAARGGAGTGFSAGGNGAGGGGSISLASTASASAGGNGSPGIVIIEEYT